MCFVCDVHTISATGITKFGCESISFYFFRSFFLFLSFPVPFSLFSLLKCRYKRVTSLPLDVVMSSTFHRTRCSSLMDDAREICNIVPFPGFSSSVSGGRGNDGPFLMAEHSLLSSKITLLLNELITRYHYVTFFFFYSYYFYQIG